MLKELFPKQQGGGDITPPLFLFLLIGFFFLYHPTLQAKTYQTADAFINQSFDGNPPTSDMLWIKKTLRQKAEKILAHNIGFLRIRYRSRGQKSVWILNEIGKKKPITVGITINQSKVETIKILAFREKRGWEVKHSFFTDQFINTYLKKDLHLNQHIDGISGATLSVRALTKLARLALLFDNAIRQ